MCLLPLKTICQCLRTRTGSRLVIILCEFSAIQIGVGEIPLFQLASQTDKARLPLYRPNGTDDGSVSFYPNFRHDPIVCECVIRVMDIFAITFWRTDVRPYATLRGVSQLLFHSCLLNSLCSIAKGVRGRERESARTSTMRGDTSDDQPIAPSPLVQQIRTALGSPYRCCEFAYLFRRNTVLSKQYAFNR